MLSYRHSFHAGNFADILKHIVLVEALVHMGKKDSPFEYIDTHSGAGLFDLRSGDAQKLQEYTNGIRKLAQNPMSEFSAYLSLVKAFNLDGEVDIYPGSPAIAKHYLRVQDRAWLYELHPQDFAMLKKNMARSKKIKVACEDGLIGLLARVPPASRRAIVLIDPSYEIKSEYDDVFHTLAEAYKKFSTGMYIIWYPVVDRSRIDRMEKQFCKSGIRNIQRFELGVRGDSKEMGMTASGVFVINPPWTLFKTMSQGLPKLASILSETKELFYKNDIIVEE